MGNDLLSVKVSRKTVEADGIASFELTDPGNGDLPAFTAGSHVDVHIDGAPMRQYSLCNDPAERNRYLLGVLRELDGRGGSAAMHDQVQQGDLLNISPPRNNFELREDASFSLLLAGGIGVTPVLAMAQRLHFLGREFVMHYCTRTRSRTAFHDFIHQAPFARHVQFHFDDGAQAQLLDIPATVAARPDNADLYVCGPGAFMEIVIAKAAKGWPDEAIRREYFSADPDLLQEDDGSFKVKFAGSGVEYVIPGDKSIVDALAEQGVQIPVSCEQGICGTCLTNVIEGEPDHRDAFLTNEEHAANDQMTLCCSRSKGPLLVLDL